MSTSDESITEIIEEAETYARRARESPETAVSDLPRLAELLKRHPGSEQEVQLRNYVLRAIYRLTRQNPDGLGDRYPEIVERTLDTPESKVIARHILHRGVSLVSDGVPPEMICEVLSEGLAELSENLYGDYDELPGHGATAIQVYQKADNHAEVMTGRRRLAMKAFNDAFSGLVKYRAGQRGVDPIDGFVDLRAEYTNAGNQERFGMGFGPDGSIVDIIERGELYSKSYARWYTSNGCIAPMLVLLVERTAPQILRTEAVLAERIH
jgi:hypothetical protein